MFEAAGCGAAKCSQGCRVLRVRVFIPAPPLGQRLSHWGCVGRRKATWKLKRQPLVARLSARTWARLGKPFSHRSTPGGRGLQKGSLKRELVFKTDGETEYAQVTKMLGNSRVETLCIADGRSRQCKIRGSLRVWIQAGDIVLISLRDFQDTKADVIWKYTADEARKLKRSGALPDGTKLNENDAGGGAYV